MIDRSTLASKRQKKRSDYAVYRTSEGGDKPKYYALDMFPYPSGAGLHVGHPKGYIATDVVSRKKKLEGYNVLHPMGFDSFGLPTENYAMKNKIHPSVATDQNIGVFIEQLKKIGFNYDRDRMVSTADPEFYKWTQRMFIKLYGHRYDSEAEKARPVSELKDLLVAKGESEKVQTSRIDKKYSKVLILDGLDGDGKSNWIPWLSRTLRADGYDVQVPMLPTNSKEDLDLVRQIDFVMKEYGKRIDEKTLIVGHSLGCVLALHLIQALQQKIDTLFVAPCFDGMDRQYAIFTTPRFADYEGALAHYYGQVNLDRSVLSRYLGQCTVMLSTDDPYIPYNDAVKYFKKHIPDGQIETFMDKGHFNIASGCLELPEVYKIIEGKNEGQKDIIPVWTLHHSHYEKDETKIAQLLEKHSYSDDGFVDVTCAYIRLADGRIVLQHLVKDNFFVLPGGKVDKDETIEQAFIRECQEEVGITPTHYNLFGVCKVAHHGAPYRLWYYDVTAYDGEITNLEPSKHDLHFARIEKSDNRWGMQVVLENTVVSDADELNNSFRDVILCEKDFRQPGYKIEEWIDAPLISEQGDADYATLYLDMEKKQYVLKGQKGAENGKKEQEEKTSPEIAAYHSRCRKQSQSPSGDKSDKENFSVLTEDEKIDRYIDSEKRLAFISHAPINWCPSCMTALANEDLDGNTCERCGTTIERRKMRQWMIRITDYAQRLLDGLDLLPERQDNIKAMQRHWIGRSEGTTFQFGILNFEFGIEVYTTRIDTVYGVTFVSLAPEHPLVEQITTDAQRDAVMAYVEESKNKTDVQRQEAKEKTGVWTGAYAINPFNNEQIPIRVADYVLMDYGTGAVMAVPAHDERDWEFAKKFDLEIKEVVVKLVGERRNEGIFRKIAIGIVENEKQEYLIQSVTKGGKTIYCLPGGGIDEGESGEDAVVREAIEETGFKNFSEIFKVGTVEANYFNEVRGIYRQALATGYFLKLKDYEQIETQLTDLEKQSVIDNFRCDKQKALELLSGNSKEHFPLLNSYVNGEFKRPFCDHGVLIHSGEFDGLTSQEAIPAMQARLDEKGIGKKKINYRIQDRVFSRQRYRGEPIPMIYVPKRKVHELRFRDGTRRDALGVTKTIETRAGNPDEKERFFGNIAIGDIIAATYVETGEYKHFLVTKTYYWKQIADLRDTGEETMKRIYSTGKAPASLEQLVNDFEAISSDYAARIRQHGLYGFAIEPYDIASDITSNNYTIRPMASDELPLTLPDVAHYEPTGTEEGPLAKISEWIELTLPDGTPARRESNTMPGRAGSSRYRLRYMDPHNTHRAVGSEQEQYRGQVDLYVGGMEHACRHLIYARFRHKFLKDIGVVTTEEPFKRLKGVGLVLAEDGRKMSKRRGNVINPDDVIAEFGTDAFRSYEMFMGPFESEVARSTAGVKGVKRFLDKVVKISEKVQN